MSLSYLEFSHEAVGPQRIGIIHLQGDEHSQQFKRTQQRTVTSNSTRGLTLKLMWSSRRSDGSMLTL